MFPKGVLHKRNGHRQPPATEALSPGDVIRLVHAGHESSPDSTYDLVKFAQVVGSERRAALAEQAARDVDALRSSLEEALDRTREAFDRGELADVRRSLETARAQADLAARIVGQLGAAARRRSTRPTGSERRLVDLNALTAQTLDRLGPRLGATVTVTSHMAPELPRIVGSAGQLQQVLGALVTEVERRAKAGSGPRAISIATSRGDEVLRGERTVQIQIIHEGIELPEAAVRTLFHPFSAAEPPPEETAIDLHTASRIVAEHGGVVSASTRPGGGVCVTLEFPAV